MAGNPEDWPEIISPGAFDACLPASVPVRGPDGEVIEGAMADVVRDDAGLRVVFRSPVVIGSPGSPFSFGPVPERIEVTYLTDRPEPVHLDPGAVVPDDETIKAASDAIERYCQEGRKP